MSRLRSTVPSKDPAPDYPDSMWMIREAVRGHDELIYGKLDDTVGGHCAIGWFFEENPGVALAEGVIDEVARINDSVKTSSPRVRRAKVLQWLNWKLCVLAGRAKPRPRL
jgi:hypothetical protein